MDKRIFVCVRACVRVVNSLRVDQRLTQLGEHNDSARYCNHNQLVHDDLVPYSWALKLKSS